MGQAEIYNDYPITPSDSDIEKIEENVHHDSLRQGEENDLVEFAPNDPENPINWPWMRKWRVLLSLSLANFSCLW